MKLGSVFTGYGGLDGAAEQHFGAETVWCSDIDPGACKIIAHRYPGVPNLGDITRVDWSQVEPVEVLTGGFPCQDLSHAGKRAGMHGGTRSGLWSHMAAAIEQLRPRYVVAENVRGLLSASAASDLEPCPWCLGGAADGEPALRALGCVLGDLAELGYDTRVCGLRAADVGAPHGRYRIFIFATDTQRGGRDGRTRQLGPRRWAEPQDGGHAAPGTTGDGRHQRRPEPARLIGGSDAAECGNAVADAERIGDAGRRSFRDLGSAAKDRGGEAWQQRDRDSVDHCGPTFADAIGSGRDGRAPEPVRGSRHRVAAAGSRQVDWGPYAPAIHRWESVLGRVAPAPTETGARGSQRLSPTFVEWLMGLPAGWVTEVPGLARNAQLKALGNGVVPQQALAALRLMDQIERAAA